MDRSFLFRLCLLVSLAQASVCWGFGVELFAKGTASKSHVTESKYTTSISASTGFAISLFSGVRVEARYTNQTALQSELEIVSGAIVGTIFDFKTQTDIYSVGLSLDLLGPRSSFQPFLYVGAGYIETKRSYFFALASSTSASFHEEPKQTGVSGNLGAGFRIRLANALAFEVEAFAYGLEVDKPNPLINLYGTVGIRLFL